MLQAENCGQSTNICSSSGANKVGIIIEYRKTGNFGGVNVCEKLD